MEVFYMLPLDDETYSRYTKEINYNDKDKKNKIIDWSIFAILLIITGIAAWKTYINVLGLFSVFATFIYTVSIWQKNTIVYKILGIICSCFWIWL